MDRAQIENAILSLRRMLSRDDLHERDYQKWFENNAVVFECLGYSEIVPHPDLTDGGTTVYTPDFLVRRADNGLWEIFEIKTPDARIIKSNTRRKDFYASLSKYFAQCVEYSEYFDDEAHRIEFSQLHGFKVQKSPRRWLVAGSDDGLDHSEVHALLNQRGYSVQLLTYDNIVAKLEFYRARHSGEFERLTGFSIHLLIKVGRLEGEDNFILDVGSQPEVNRIALYIDPEDDLCFEVFDSAGNPQLVRLPVGVDTIVYDDWAYLIVEGGTGRNFAYMAVDINDRNCFYAKFPGMQVRTVDPHCVVGSDIAGQKNSKFAIKTNLIFNRTLTFKERVGVRGEIFEMSRPDDYHLEFSDHQFGFTAHHPFWLSRTNYDVSKTSSLELVQPISRHQPWFVGPRGRHPMFGRVQNEVDRS